MSLLHVRSIAPRAEAGKAPSQKAASAVLVSGCAGCTDSDRRLTFNVVSRPGHRKQKAHPRFVSLIRPDELRSLETALAADKPAADPASASI